MSEGEGRDRDGADTFLYKWGGRKFIITVATGLISTVLVWFGKIDGTVFATVILATVGAFITGNVVATLADKRGSKNVVENTRTTETVVSNNRST